MIRKLLEILGLTGGSRQPAPASTPPPAAPDPELQRRIDDGLSRFKAWQEEHRLPAVFLDSTGPGEATPAGSRVGGPAWLPDGTEWPVDREGKRLAFLAQLDLGKLPALPDFPTHGLLQFFIGTDDVFGADFDRPEAGSFKVLWHEDASVPGAMHENIVPGGEMHEDYSPLSKEALAKGFGLTGRAYEHKPGVDVWYVDRDLPDVMRKDEKYGFAVADAVYDYADEVQQSEPYEAHHMGGHPQFTQSDYRGVDGYRDVDRVLLNLWSQDGAGKPGEGRWEIIWGDAGQGQFTIRRKDLLERRFDRALYQWDCS